jgi:hypothetical protein
LKFIDNKIDGSYDAVSDNESGYVEVKVYQRFSGFSLGVGF